MERLFVLLLVGSVAQLSFGASSDDALACVERDVVQTLVGNPGEGAVRISREWPARFPPIQVPDEFALIGSRSSNYFTLVSFKSKLSGEAARDSLRVSFVDDEWQFPESSRQRVRGGFQNPTLTKAQEALSACHDRHGQLTAMFSPASEEATYIVLMGSMKASGMSCSQMYGRGMAIGGETEILPNLTLPDDAATAVIGGAGISSSGDAASTRIQVETDLSPTDQLEFFGRQLIDQEWQQEAEWVGRIVSGSAWISRDGAKSGLLRIQRQENNLFKLDFQVVRLN